MRKEPYTIGNYVHVVKRGARGLSITRTMREKLRFLSLLYYLNDKQNREGWERDLDSLNTPSFAWPKPWSSRVPLVKILAFCLMPNHFHLILKEIVEGGISDFIKKLSISMSMFHNNLHREKGSIFQGAYRSRTILDDNYLRYVAAYVMVKNPLELLDGGIVAAKQNFDEMYARSIQYNFASLKFYASDISSVILDKDIYAEIFASPNDFKSCAKDMILGYENLDEEIKALFIE
ncbi:MAG: hypothetical protein A2928_03985 [Candidatus Taylorbacteria bacterium RIFCSPLOWO2_01_FULL_45_15b]|uniref:Transposase IS200-like domain-containing protein n=1 Tax=Candidatus Taylorbacteria bacterium RIFCSPLOWO2_01_FULL_45_15b TaxID=1802319 RepID=A0A1G2NG25_9BACT|nr:MAG: hypothetical protein A2928_03985 [Candidatus Taylorbacteria bacterium RIFCSPLOWO2_01_FULL_45_15b]